MTGAAPVRARRRFLYVAVLLSAASLPVAAVVALTFFVPWAPLALAVAALLGVALARVGAAVRSGVRSRWVSWRQQRLLAAALADAGSAAQRDQVTRAFWREQRQLATTQLMQRFRDEPVAPPLYDVELIEGLGERVWDEFRGAAWGLFALCSLLVVASLLSALVRGQALFAALTVAVVFSVSVSSVASLMLVRRALIERLDKREARRIFVSEQRRIATMAELAGGLSLADSEDEALRGALSDEVVSAGELELAAPPREENT